MNENLEGLLKRNGINPEEFLRFAEENSIQEYERYNYPISKYAVYGPYEEADVNVDDIIGMSSYLLDGTSFVENFMNKFADYGDNYSTRANGMLDYNSDEIMTMLKRSFKEESMKLHKIGDKYFIGGNGVHRYFLLKMHSLMEKFKGNDSKYIIPSTIQEMDYLKTYVNFIGSILWDETYSVYQDLDRSFNYTGKARVLYKSKELILDNNELIAFMKGRIEALKQLDETYYADIISSLWQRCKWEDTGLLMKFIETYLPEISHLMNIEDYADLEEAINNMLQEDKTYGNS